MVPLGFCFHRSKFCAEQMFSCLIKLDKCNWQKILHFYIDMKCSSLVLCNLLLLKWYINDVIIYLLYYLFICVYVLSTHSGVVG